MRDAIVVVGGAFNPVHTQHIALLCRAKEELEKTGAWNIIGGYLAVATNGYVLEKLRSRGERTMKLEHRLAMVREAMKDMPWLINSPFQEEMLKQQDGSAFALTQRVIRLLKNDNVQIMILIGGDRMVRRGVPIWRAASPGRVPVIRVGVGRMSDENVDLLQLWQSDLNGNLIRNPAEFILLNISLPPVSSSLIRTHLTEWFTQPSKQPQIENDLVHGSALLNINVLNYIKTHRNDLYIDT